MNSRKQNRNAIIGKIHIAKQQLALDDATYRDILWRITGKRSCSDMRIAELKKILDEMMRLGFKPTKRRPRVAQDKKKLFSKIEAIMLDCELSWEYVQALAKQMHKQPIIEWLNYEQLNSVLQALIVYQQRIKRAKAAAKRKTNCPPR